MTQYRPRYRTLAATVALAVSTLMAATNAAPAAAYCYESTVMSPRPYQGNHGERFRLDDGSIWQDTSYRYDYRYEYYPTVTVCPDDSTIRLRESEHDVWRLR